MVVRYRAGARKGFCAMAAAAVFITSLVFAEEGARQGASAQQVSPEVNAFYARLASFLGMEPSLFMGIAPEFQRDGVANKDAVLLLLFAHKRTQRLLREEKITTEDRQKTFRDSISRFLEERRAGQDWRAVISGELGFSLHDMTKQANDTMRQAMRPTVGDAESARAIRVAEPKEVPEDLVQPLLQRLRVRPEVLKQAWGEVESTIGGSSPRPAVILLVLAKEKTDRLLEFGAVGREEKDKVFLDSLAYFTAQIQTHPGIGWGTLASQVGLHSADLQAEALSIFKAARMRKAEREKLSGARAEGPAVPRELSVSE
jgi:hypothetical protein